MEPRQHPERDYQKYPNPHDEPYEAQCLRLGERPPYPGENPIEWAHFILIDEQAPKELLDQYTPRDETKYPSASDEPFNEFTKRIGLRPLLPGESKILWSLSPFRMPDDPVAIEEEAIKRIMGAFGGTREGAKKSLYSAHYVDDPLKPMPPSPLPTSPSHEEQLLASRRMLAEKAAKALFVPSQQEEWANNLRP